MSSLQHLPYRAVLALLPATLCVSVAPTPVHAGEPAANALEEIVVTARKSEERLQDVPLAVTAISQEALARAGAVDVRDLAQSVPGLFYRAFSYGHPNLFIRGVGTRSYDAGAESSVGTFIDGVYIARFGAQVQDLADVERVEVLRGPQGALFGRNTIGGALNIVTHKPDDDFLARGSVTYGAAHFGGNELNVSGLVSGPLVADKAFGQLSYSRSDAAGPTKIEGTGRLVNGGGTQTVRGRLVLNAADAWQVDLIADYFESVDNTFVWKANDVGGTRTGILLKNPFIPVAPINPDSYITPITPGLGNTSRDGSGLSATVTYAGERVNMTSITAYRQGKTKQDNDTDATANEILRQPATEDSDQFSEELRFASTSGGPLTFGGKVNWLGGLYYFQESIDRKDQLIWGKDSAVIFVTGVPTETVSYFAKIDTRSWAAFAHAGTELSDRWKLDLDLRYSEDKKSADLAATEDHPGLIVVPYDVSPDPKFSSTDPTVTLSFKASPDAMLFASYAHGFKSGAFQFLASNAFVAETYAMPESVDSYQVGLRSDWVDGRLRFNVTAFQYKYDDIQVPRVEVVNNAPVVRLTNAAKSTVKGVEVEGVAGIKDGFRLEYAYAYLDATYDDFLYAPGKDFTGNQMTRSPKNTGNLALVFDAPTSLGDITARIAGNYVDTFYFEPDNAKIDPGTKEPSHTTLDASIGLGHGPWTLTLWGKNLTDEESRASVFNVSGNQLMELWAPRQTYGLTLSGRM